MDQQTQILSVTNFCTKQELETILKYTYDKNWSIQTSTTGDSSEFFMLDLTNIKFFNETLFNKLKKILKVNCSLERVYFNLQYPNQHGSLHQDYCQFTALLYVTPWNPELGGFTQIMSNKIVVIPPVQNTLICFPSHLFHKGYACTHNKRISLAYKLNIHP